jgi:hypothetical protein
MAVSVTLSGGGSIIAWQTPSGVSFQRFDASHEPVGGVTSVATGPTIWLSAQALPDGGFSIVWDVDRVQPPTLQEFDANGVAVGPPDITFALPIADVAFSSRAMSPTTGGALSVTSTTLSDGGTVIVTVDRSSPVLSTTIEHLDAVGFPYREPYVYSSGLATFSDAMVTPLANSAFAVSFIHSGSNSSVLHVLSFAGDGTLLANTTPVAFSGPAGGFPQVTTHSAAGLPNGGFVLSWTSSADTEMHVQEFDAAGTAVGDSHTLGPSDQTTAAAIDVFPNGDYVVTWTSPDNSVEHAAFSATVQGPVADNDLIIAYSGFFGMPAGPHDVILAGQGQTVIGNNLNNIITANDYASWLDGSGGDDTLIAGRNAYTMIGGGGGDKDIFVFPYLPTSDAGLIIDFVAGVKKLDFSGIFETAGYTGTDPVADGVVAFEWDPVREGTKVLFDPDGPAGGAMPTVVTTLYRVSPDGLTTDQLFHPENNPPPAGLIIIASGQGGQYLSGGLGDDIFYTGDDWVIMTGLSGADRYVFQSAPWNNLGHITDFELGTDILDFSALFAGAGYTGSDPVGDGYIRFEADGAGGTRILFDADGPAGCPWPIVVTTLDSLYRSDLTWDWLSNADSTPPPPPPPPGLTLIAKDVRGQVLTGGEGDDVFYAAHKSAVMIGNGGANTFIFQYLPWGGARITDFQSGVDKLDLTRLFDAAGYEGTDPIGDGILRFESDGAGGTKVQFDPDGPAPGNPWPFLIATLDNVLPSSVSSTDWIY